MMRRSGFPEFRDTTVYDKLYTILETRPDGVSLQTLAEWTGLTIGTIKKNLQRMKKEYVVERVMRSDRFVWRLTR
jgi:hypothetical protein